jgi:hypothetical protein
LAFPFGFAAGFAAPLAAGTGAAKAASTNASPACPAAASSSDEAPPKVYKSKANAEQSNYETSQAQHCKQQLC